ncbi:lytic transglycosylase domain-containing protein [Longispora sp. NPDC051575]|uniref:lytic transglycosylase domain-containing protein n=1 Tax=Longispora sp. NPDC051575 TaxID=3154943 RepID=UPI00342ABF62
MRGFALGALVMVLAVSGCAGDPPRPKPVAKKEAASVPSPSASPSSAPTSAAPTVAPSPSAKPTKAPVKPAQVKPSYQPPPAPVPTPPAAPPHTPGSDCRRYEGTNAERPAVKAALTAAANRQYWQSVHFTVPVNLMKAIAWQESGWQSAIIACDGGMGTMQLMPGTVEWMNLKFNDTPEDPKTLKGNTVLGAEYLAWLIRYFGDLYFDHTYDLANPDLLNVVIAAYNVGHAGVQDEATHTIRIPNQRYVDNVRALMTECECLAF